MNFQIDLRSFFLILAVLQSIIFSTLFLKRGFAQRRISDLLLAAFLLTLAATLSEHIAGWLGLYQSQVLTFFPFGNNFLFAPLAYLYVKSVTDAEYRFRGKQWLHFLPALIYFAIHFYIWLMPVAEKLTLLQNFGNNYYYLIEGIIDLLILTVYSILSVRHYRAYLRWLPTEFSNLLPVSLHWIRNFLLILVCVCLVEWAFSITGLFYNIWYDVRYWDYFIRAVLLYYLSVAGYLYSQPIPVFFSQSTAQEAKEEQPLPTETLPTAIVLSFITNDKPYLNPELTLADFARQVNLPATLVSQTINTGLNKNFNDLINEFRVQEICTRLLAGEHKTKTLLGVGLDSGFNSKATFNRSFKKVTGFTPKEWLDSQNSSLK
jgi:AraC-like DNA-binding protein